MTDPDIEQSQPPLQGPPEIPLSPEHRLHLRSRVLDAYDAAARLPAQSPPAGVRLFLTRVLAAAACVALGSAVGWFARASLAPATPAPPAPALAAGRPADATSNPKAVPGDFWSYRRLVRLSSSHSVAADSSTRLRSPGSSMWDLPVKGH